MKNKKFWRWTNLAPETGQEGEAERVLELYGTIAEESWFDDDVTPQMFREELFAGNGPVTIWLNSPGGDCIAASQIYSMLMDYTGSVPSLPVVSATRRKRRSSPATASTSGSLVWSLVRLTPSWVAL